jgi:hypothetical protein
MARRIYSKKMIFGLEDELVKKISTDAIMGAMSDVEAANNKTTVPSTASVVELKQSLDKRITETQQSIDNIIDDSVSSAGDKTWSIDKIKEFVASVDDTVVVANLDERNGLNAYDSLIAYVLDTSGDDSLGDAEGKPFAYVYADGEWKVLTALAQGDVDTDNLVTFDDIINDLTTGGEKKALSAEMGKQLSEVVVPNMIAAAATKVVTEEPTLDGDKLTVLANPVGDIFMNRVEIVTDEGIVVVDAALTGDKEVTIYPENSGEYDGKAARISYIALASEVDG